MDGLIYGVAASLGFAAYENISYVLYYEKGPSFDIAIVRELLQYQCMRYCGIIMGFLISQSIFEKTQLFKLILALFIPVGIHGLYNFSFQAH